MSLPNQLSEVLNWLAGEPYSIASYARRWRGRPGTEARGFDAHSFDARGFGAGTTASDGERIDPRTAGDLDTINDQRRLTIEGPPAPGPHGPQTPFWTTMPTGPMIAENILKGRTGHLPLRARGTVGTPGFIILASWALRFAREHHREIQEHVPRVRVRRP